MAWGGHSGQNLLSLTEIIPHSYLHMADIHAIETWSKLFTFVMGGPIGAFHSILHVTEGKIRGKQSALLSNSQHSVNSELILELSTKPSSYMKTFIMFDKIL